MICSGISKPSITLTTNQNSSKITNISHLYICNNNTRISNNWFCTKEPYGNCDTFQFVIRSIFCTKTIQVINLKGLGVCFHCLSLYNNKNFKRAARYIPPDTPPVPPQSRMQATIQALTRKVKRLTWRLNKPLPEASTPEIDIIKGHITGGDLSTVLSKLRGLLNHCQTDTTFESCAGRLSFTIDILKSLQLESQGKGRQGSKYLSHTQHILANLRLSGQVGYEKIAHNLGLATERTARSWNYKFPRFECGFSDSNFITIAAIYKDLKEQYDIKEDVLCFLAEDETVIIPEPDWDERDDCIVGFCGKKCQAM